MYRSLRATVEPLITAGLVRSTKSRWPNDYYSGWFGQLVARRIVAVIPQPELRRVGDGSQLTGVEPTPLTRGGRGAWRKSRPVAEISDDPAEAADARYHGI